MKGKGRLRLKDAQTLAEKTVVYSSKMNNPSNIALKAKEATAVLRNSSVTDGFCEASMAKGVASKMGGIYSDHRKSVLMGAAILGAIILALSTIHILLPREYRACALMPGFCKQDPGPKKNPFQQLDEGYHGQPKFGLSTGR